MTAIVNCTFKVTALYLHYILWNFASNTNTTLLGRRETLNLSPCASRRLEQERSALQKKLKARGVTADQVVGVRSTQMEEEMEELKRKNAELETQIVSIR